MEALLDLAEKTGLEVRIVGSEAGESPPASAVCKVRGELWVVLARSDPSDVQIEVLARALKSQAAELIEDSCLPPAVRRLLDPD